MLEKDTERDLGYKLKALNCLFYKFTSPGQRGVPDRIVICPDGQVLFVELKRPAGILAAAQKLQLKRLREHRQEVRVIWGPLDAQELVEECRRHSHAV